jgi:hypothetical protein
MTTHYYLGKPNRGGLCAIYLCCREGAFVAHLNTRERIEPRHWDAVRQRAKLWAICSRTRRRCGSIRANSFARAAR